MRAPGDILGRRVFIRAVADTVAAGDEEHGYRRDAGHEERVVISAADHALVTRSRRFARGDKRFHDRRAGLRRSIGIDDLVTDLHLYAR